MQELKVSCGCGRTMGSNGREGRGAFRCGCGVRIRVAGIPRAGRSCWYGGCTEGATTEKPLSLCAEHERDAVNRLAHLVVRFDWKAVADASMSVDPPSRPLGSYRQAKPGSCEGWVYFMRRERFIKIGTTTDLRRRAQELNATVLAKQPGSYSEEARLHKRFAALRRHGEWFEPGPELIALMNELRTAEGLPPIPA